MKKIVLITISGLVILTAILVVILPQFYTKESEVLQSITISPKWVNQAQFAGIFVAIDKGFYEEYGLDVDIKDFKIGQNVLKDLISGESEFGLMSAHDLLANVAKGEPIKGVAAYYQVSPYAIASLKQFEITSPAELKGKRLGVKGGPGAEAELMYRILLRSSGVDDKFVNFVYLPFGQSEYQDLLDEKADAIGLYRVDELYKFDINGVSYNLLNPEQYSTAVYNDVLVATADYLSQNPVITRNFIEATRKGWEYALSHKNEAVDITQKYITDDNYKDPFYQRYILDKSQPLIDIGSVPIGHMGMNRWQFYAQVLINLNLIPKDFDINSAITLEYQ